MAKKFQTNPDKAAAREAAKPGKKKKGAEAASKPPEEKKGEANGTDLALNGGAVHAAKDESIKMHFDEAVRLSVKAKSGNGKVRAAKAVAKKDNVDTTLLAKVVSYADRDQDEVAVELRELLRYVEICLPKVQFDLPIETTITREAQIFDDGFRAGRDARSNTTDNPHQPNTIAWFCWDSGYAAGQKKNMELIGTTAPIDSKGKVPGAAKDPLTGSSAH